MGYFDLYKTRVSASGTSIVDAQKNSSINFINNNFINSPNYQILDIDGVNTDCRIIQTKENDKKELLLKPGVTKNIGAIVTIGTDKWLTMQSFVNDIFPKLQIQKCNHILKWKNSLDEIKQYPCIITNQLTSGEGTDIDKYITLPSGEQRIIIQNNANTILLKEDKRFFIGSKVWKITFVNEIVRPGLLDMFIKVDLESANDDSVNGIADNVMPTTTPENGNLW